MVTTDMLSEAFRARLAEVPAAAAALPPAKLWHGPAAERSNHPYAALTVRESRREELTGSALVTYDVDVRAYTLAHEPGGLASALDKAWAGTNADPASGLALDPAEGSVVHCLARPGRSIESTGEPHGGETAKRVTLTYAVLVHSKEGV